jgi:hypothetical protein
MRTLKHQLARAAGASGKIGKTASGRFCANGRSARTNVEGATHR